MKYENKYGAVLNPVILIIAVILLTGCRNPDKPRMQFGAYFGEPGGMAFPNPDALGSHNYKYGGAREINGMLYTCKGGFIDVGHVREAADRAAYLVRLTYKNIMRKQDEFTFNIIEPSKYYVTISYPADWDKLGAGEKEKIAKDMAVHVGQYLAHTTLVWHETITWFGWAWTVVFSERISAFSPEDPYSDVLGTEIGAKAVYDERGYDEAVTILINQAMKELDVQPAEAARRAVKSVYGKWYSGSGYVLVHMKVRNFDVGLDNGKITPFLVPEICPNAEAQPWPVPSPNVLRTHGFNIKVEMEPRTKTASIHRSIGLDRNARLIPERDFPQIMSYIEKHASQGPLPASAHKPNADKVNSASSNTRLRETN